MSGPPASAFDPDERPAAVPIWREALVGRESVRLEHPRDDRHVGRVERQLVVVLEDSLTRRERSRLVDRHEAALRILSAKRREGLLHGRRVVGEVVDHADAARDAPQLHAALDAIEGCEGLANRVAVRPERVRIAAGNEPLQDGGSRLEGTVAQVVFLGMYTQFHVDTRAGRVVSHRLAGEAPASVATGERVTLSWEPEQASPLGD